MKIIISLICLILVSILPTYVKAVSENELVQMQEETNRILESIEEQRLDEEGTSAFVYTFFITVAIAMVFEVFVRSYRKELCDKKEAEGDTKDIRKKLLITYVIHLLTIGITLLICTYVLKFTQMYTWFLILITVYIVEIAPLFSIRFKKKKRRNK